MFKIITNYIEFFHLDNLLPMITLYSQKMKKYIRICNKPAQVLLRLSHMETHCVLFPKESPDVRIMGKKTPFEEVCLEETSRALIKKLNWISSQSLMMPRLTTDL
ncbi:hypothetical protein CDAR_200361 [Caerostris darwini]|uniref:Uncharacterized protein n=1 Tax=Caerostris darwini TaxID=1538125 RepID=A0AAV4RJQ7_9ARAC|nr:hypothetical protein CDAR_200361 [Caerostris darwini]